MSTHAIGIRDFFPSERPRVTNQAAHELLAYLNMATISCFEISFTGAFEYRKLRGGR